MVNRSSLTFSKFLFFLHSNKSDLSVFYIVILILHIFNGTFGSFVNQTNATAVVSPIKNVTKLIKKLAECRYIN
jgi:hypothetical protein